MQLMQLMQQLRFKRLVPEAVLPSYATLGSAGPDHNTSVVSFPCSYPAGTILAKDMSAIDQLELVKTLQTDWSDNSVSCTIYYSASELPAIRAWLAEHYDTGVKTTSFLLHSEHGFQQAPYEEITRESYEGLIARTRPITALTVGAGGVLDPADECINGSCPVK
jgi:ribonucleoside-triphosphate reductase